jgi:hypothetical protein
MKAINFSFFCLLFFYSCKQSNVEPKNSMDSSKNNIGIPKNIINFSKNNIDSSTIKLHEGQWYFNFKTEVFMRCLKKIYPKSFTAFIDSSDASSSANIEWLRYDSEVLKIADSLANNFAKRPEASWTIENTKVTLNVCIGYRNSIELDSVAVFFYHKFYKPSDWE